MTAAERNVVELMRCLRDDLYREVRAGVGSHYAMENPPGNCRVEFEMLSDESFRARVLVRGKLRAEADDPDLGWLDEVAL